MVKLINSWFRNHRRLNALFFNTGWLVFKNCFRLLVSFIVSILVARYLGPRDFGIFSYALSIVTFLGTFTYLGLSGIIIRDLVRFPQEKNAILGTTFALKFIGGALVYLLVILIVKFTDAGNTPEYWVLLILGLSLFAYPFEVIELWFNSQTQAKYAVIATSAALVLASLLKIICIVFKASLLLIALATSGEFFITGVLLILAYRYKGFSILDWTVKIKKARELLGQSWILILSGALALVNLKVDQIMLRWIKGAEAVGIYSVAAKISEAWYFLPAAISLSVYPKLLELRKTNKAAYERRLQQLIDILFVAALLIAVFINFTAYPVINLLYGIKFSSAAPVLIIHIWAGIFIFMRFIFIRWVFIENELFFSLVSSASGAMINFLLNLYFIPKLGGIGAAIATLVSYATASYFSLFFYAKTWPLAKMMSKSLILPIRFVGEIARSGIKKIFV